MNNKLNESGWARIIIFAVLLGFISYFTVTCARGMSEMLRYFKLFESGEAAAYLNGVDMTAVTEVYTEYGLTIELMVAGMFAFVLVLFNLFWFVLYRIVLFRQTTITTQYEYQLGKKIQLGLFVTASVISTGIIAYRSALLGLCGLVFALPMLLFSWLFCILPMKKHVL